LENQELVRRIEPKVREALLHIEHGHDGHEMQIRFDSAVERTQFIKLVCGFGSRIAVLKVEIAEARVNRLGADPAVRIPACIHGYRLTCPFDIRQLPGLIEQRLLWAVEAEENLESSICVRGNPVRLLAGWGVRPEV